MSYIDGFNMNPIIFVVRNDWCRVDDNDTVVGGSVVENIDFLWAFNKQTTNRMIHANSYSQRIKLSISQITFSTSLVRHRHSSRSLRQLSRWLAPIATCSWSLYRASCRHLV